MMMIGFDNFVSASQFLFRDFDDDDRNRLRDDRDQFRDLRRQFDAISSHSTSGIEELSEDAMDVDSNFGEVVVPNLSHVGTPFLSEDAMDVGP